MKILTRKSQDQILKLVTACSIIANHAIDSVKMTEDYEKMIENLCDISFEAGGIKGMEKVQRTVEKYFKDNGISDKQENRKDEMEEFKEWLDKKEMEIIAMNENSLFPCEGFIPAIPIKEIKDFMDNLKESKTEENKK